MSDALVISAANLDVIERNLGAVAEELSGVVSNVDNVNAQMNNVEKNVETLNDEVKGLVKEIRETTIITNARQSIMYNNEQINKRFGYYDAVRRNTKGIINAIGKSHLSKRTLAKLREEIIFNNPDYWLTNALATVISWLSDDRINYEKELNNTLSINNKKASLFFSIVNLKFDRVDASKSWLKRYLSLQDPSNLDKDFVTVLDLVSTGIFGDEFKQTVLSKIEDWYSRLKSKTNLLDDNIKRWEDYIESNKATNISMPQLERFSNTTPLLKDTLAISLSYSNIKSDLEEIISESYSNRSIDDILSNLIYDYEDNELVYQKDNLKNELLINCNGDASLAQELFDKQQVIYEDKIDIINLLTNIVLYSKEFNVSCETKKLALGLIKDNLKTAIDKANEKRFSGDINIQVEDFQTKTTDGTNYNEVDNELSTYINHKYKDDSRYLIAILIVVNILGIMGMFITSSNPIFVYAIAIILVIGNIALFIKLYNKVSELNKIKSSDKALYKSVIEMVMAEAVDYTNLIKESDKELEQLSLFIDGLNPKDYLKSNDERNINIGDNDE